MVAMMAVGLETVSRIVGLKAEIGPGLTTGNHLEKTETWWERPGKV